MVVPTSMVEEPPLVSAVTTVANNRTRTVPVTVNMVFALTAPVVLAA